MVSPGLDVRLVNASKKEFHQSVIVSSIQSARQHETLKQLQQQNFDLLLSIDEAHHASSDSSRSVLEALRVRQRNKKAHCADSQRPQCAVMAKALAKTLIKLFIRSQSKA